MLSRFFIDRPIFATVLSVLITFIGAISLAALPIAQYPRITPPGVQVAITYPGANAQVVADTVAAPIEQQVTGVPGMLYMSSQSGNDGTYTLSTTFDVNVDLNTALVMVQNRVTLAMPLLPTPVQQQGIRIRKKTPDILLIINFFADENHPEKDDIYLSNYAFMHVKDEVLRVDGVSDINIIGERDYSIRAWLDPQKLASLNMSALDVSKAIQAQNIEVAPGQIGQPPASKNQSAQCPIDLIGRLTTPEDFGNIIIKVGADKTATAKKGGQAPKSGSGSGGLPTSGITDPLMASGSMSGSASMSNSTSSGNGTASTTPPSSSSDGTPSDGTPSSSGGGGSTGGGTTGGGGTTTGGGASQGGGTTGGSANGVGSVVADNGTDDALSGLSIDADATGQPASGGTVGRPKLTSNGIVLLKHVATLERGAQNYNQACFFNGKKSVGISVYQLPGTNALDVADRVREKMAELEKRFPEGVHYKIGYDTTLFIRESIEEVFSTLRDAVLLVTLVVLLFLQDWRAMILPMIDVPVSLIGTFAVMAVMGFSLNNISLFGLVLAIGIVVDDAIVVLENIERQMAKGLGTRAATIKAMEEISGPIIAITIVLCAVFVPCAFISGITGRFFRQFAVTIAASTIISAINALTMTPSRALLIFRMEEAAGLTPGSDGHSHGGHGGHDRPKEALPWWAFGLIGAYVGFFVVPRCFPDQLDWITNQLGIEISPETHEPTGWDRWTVAGLALLPGLLLGLPLGLLLVKPVNRVLAVFFRGFNWFFELLIACYGWIIGMGMRLSAVVLFGYAGLLGLTYVLFVNSPTGFVPQQDMGRIIVGIQLPDSASLERSKAAALQITEITRADPGVGSTITICGISFVQQASSPNFASLFVVLKPFKDRRDPYLKDEAIMARLRKQWKEQVKDATAVALASSPVPGLSVAGGFKILVEDKAGLGLDVLQTQTDLLVRKLTERKDLGLASVATNFRSKTPMYYMDIDRSKVSSLGCSLDDVNKTVEIFLGSSYVNSYNEFGRLWQVTLQADGKFRDRIQDVNLFQVRNKYGQMVSLGTLCNIREITGPIFVTRYNLSTSAPITGGLLPGVSTGDVIAGTDKIALETLPRSMKTEWTELMFMQLKEGNTAIYIFALAVLCVFLALAALYESWALPLAVILVVPMCILCSVIGVLATHNSVNIFVQIGLVVLVGLACKNAILIVEFARELHEDGKTVFEATLESSKLRLRPILMTSFAFILGVLPLVVASGAGAEMRRSLGTAVFSGMLGVTAFGIFLTPVFFYVIQGVGETSLFANKWVRTGLSLFFGGLLGGTAGWILEQLGVVYHYWGMAIGVVVGMLLVGGIRGLLKTVGVNADEEWRGLRRPRK